MMAARAAFIDHYQIENVLKAAGCIMAITQKANSRMTNACVKGLWVTTRAKATCSGALFPSNQSDRILLSLARACTAYKVLKEL